MRKFNKLLISMLFAFAFFSFDNSLVSASVTHDQGKIFGTAGTLSIETDTWSQSITTGITGYLQGIEFQIDNHWSGFDPTVFDLSIFSGTNPTTGTAIFSQQITIAQDDLDVDGLYMWDVSSSNPFFNINDPYTFEFKALLTGISIAADYQDDGNGYPGGELFKNGTALPLETSDIAFRTYVSPVPIPGAFWLLGTGLVGFVGLRRKFRK